MSGRRQRGAPAAPKVTDHALVRFLGRSGVDVEAVRTAMADALARAHGAALDLGGQDHAIVVDKMRFIVRAGHVVTVTDTGGRPSAIVIRERV